MNRHLLSRIRLGSALLVAYWLLLFTATHVPSSRLPLPLNLWDKAQHFGAYAVLAILLSLVFQKTSWSLAVRYATVFVVVVSYGALDEWLQHFIPGRNPDILDFVADVLGATFGIVVHWFLVGLLSQRASVSAENQQSTSV
jgi:VanZ family protein